MSARRRATSATARARSSTRRATRRPGAVRAPWPSTPAPAEAGLAPGGGRWTRPLAILPSDVPVYLENTAGGDNAVARRFDALALLWDAVTAADSEFPIGFCFAPCHAHAAGEDLDDAVDRVEAIVGRIDLVHANDSRDPPGTGADRPAHLGTGTIDPDARRAMIRAPGAPVVCETPGTLADMRADLEFVRAAFG